jgi:Fe-S-cluster containining protein
MPAEPWYQDGLRFECTRCGNCCTGESGTVFVSDEELSDLANLLDLARHELRAMYTRTLPSGVISLREREREDGSHECVFWDREAGCRVYARRPRQCRTWPFWRTTVETPAHWANAATTCPGIDAGPQHTAEAIVESSADDGTLGTKPDLG